MINRVSTYIDTSVTGSVVQIQHNLHGMVYPYFYTVDTSGYKTAVSLFDSRIAEAKTLDDDTFQVTFASSFEGFLDLLYFDIKTPSQGKRITALELETEAIRDLLTGYANLLQWKQMNTYLEKQIKDQGKLIADLQAQVNTLAKDVSEL